MATYSDRGYGSGQNKGASDKFRHYLEDFNDYQDKSRLIWELNAEFHLRPEDFVKYTFLEKRFKLHLSPEEKSKLDKLYSIWSARRRGADLE